MRTIWKTELPARPTPPARPEPVIQVPAQSVIRHVGMQWNGWIGIWYEVPDTEEWQTVPWRFVVTATGARTTSESEWVGLVVDGPLVWQVWRLIP